MSLLQPDYRQAVHWYSMCRDYNPSQSECSLALCLVHLEAIQMDRALSELHTILQMQQRGREMVEYLRHWDCLVPQHAANLFANKALVYGLEQDEAKYFFLLVRSRVFFIVNASYLHFWCAIPPLQWSMTQQDHCGLNTLEIEDTVRQKLLSAVGGPQIDYFETENDFCALPEVHAYLQRNEYTVHPCGDFKAAQYTAKLCGIFTAQAPPPYEVCCCIVDCSEFD